MMILLLYISSNTQATTEAQVMKKLSSTEAELKKSLYKKACIGRKISSQHDIIV